MNDVAQDIIYKLGKEIGFDLVATIARQIAHENSKPEPPAKKSKPQKPIDTVYLPIEQQVAVTLYRATKESGPRLIAQLSPTQFEAWGWEKKSDRQELIAQIETFF